MSGKEPKMVIARKLLVVLSAALLGVALIAMPAAGRSGDNAEKGQNRGYTPTEGNSADPRSSNDQGSPKNQSNPDGGGIDKPVPATQGTSDWDWNNGCGNDDDRDDDNNGWCGRKHENENARAMGIRGEEGERHGLAVRSARVASSRGALSTKGGVAGGADTDVLGASGSPAATQVLGASFSRTGPTTDVLGASGGQTDVLGAGFDALPVTGLPGLGAGIVGLALMLVGGLLNRKGKA